MKKSTIKSFELSSYQWFESVPNIANFFAICNLNAPNILGRHRHVVINVAADLLLGGWCWRRNVVRIQIAASDTVYKLNFISVRNLVEGSSYNQIGSVWSFNDPPVVDVLCVVTSNLLLMTGTTLIRIFDWVISIVAVQPAGISVSVTKRDLRTVNNFQRLTTNNRTQSTLKIRNSKLVNKWISIEWMNQTNKPTSKLAWKAEDMAESCGPALVSVDKWM